MALTREYGVSVRNDVIYDHVRRVERLEKEALRDAANADETAALVGNAAFREQLTNDASDQRASACVYREIIVALEALA